MRLDSVLEMQELFLLDAYKWERDGEVKVPAPLILDEPTTHLDENSR
jgi:hypothetical protein